VRLPEQIKSRAVQLGFAKCGITRAAPLDPISRGRFVGWLEKQYHGEMHYMSRAREKRQDPRKVLDKARSVISVLMSYYSPEKHSNDSARGKISRYAWGRDYHYAVKGKLHQLEDFISSLVTDHSSFCYVDTGPVLDKWWAEKAGMGWIGKNANLITTEMGSWVFVGEILTSLELEEKEYDKPWEHPRRTKVNAAADKKTFCGTCSRCIEACPTGAIVAPYVVDSRLCISYLTIELRGAISRELRPLIGNRIFGCDDCQDVCPWNRFAVASSEPDFHAADGNLGPPLAELLTLTREEFNHRFKDGPIKRARYPGFLRNVAVALGNSHSSEAIPALAKALSHEEALVRQHAAWALGEIGTEEAKQTLRKQEGMETDLDLKEEIKLALKGR
jgi:epoxyqueuosine reductase